MKNKTDKAAIVTDLIPRGKDVLVKSVSLESKSESGIIIAESTVAPKPTAILIACGPECKDDLKQGIGKLVMHNPYANLQMIDSYNNVFLYMQDTDIRCFINEKTIIMDASDEKVARIDIAK